MSNEDFMKILTSSAPQLVNMLGPVWYILSNIFASKLRKSYLISTPSCKLVSVDMNLSRAPNKI